MKRIQTSVGILIISLTFASYSAFGQPTRMVVLKVKDGKIAADKGLMEGVQKDLTYILKRGESIIGQASVTLVKNHVCALKVLALEPGFEPATGDFLVLKSAIEFEDLLSEFNDEKPSGMKADSVSGFYPLGISAAKKSYDGGSAFVGGLTTGTMFGLIGWGIGALVVNDKEVIVPPELYQNKEDNNQKIQFIAGYELEFRSIRRRNFNRGALIGVLASAAMILYVEQVK